MLSEARKTGLLLRLLTQANRAMLLQAAAITLRACYCYKNA
jgi:hypothetical protein